MITAFCDSDVKLDLNNITIKLFYSIKIKHRKLVCSNISLLLELSVFQSVSADRKILCKREQPFETLCFLFISPTELWLLMCCAAAKNLQVCFIALKVKCFFRIWTQNMLSFFLFWLNNQYSIEAFIRQLYMVLIWMLFSNYHRLTNNQMGWGWRLLSYIVMLVKPGCTVWAVSSNSFNQWISWNPLISSSQQTVQQSSTCNMYSNE